MRIRNYLLVKLLAVLIVIFSLQLNIHAQEDLALQRAFVPDFKNQTMDSNLDFLSTGIAELIKSRIFNTENFAFITHSTPNEELAATSILNQDIISEIAAKYLADIVIYGNITGTRDNIMVSIYVYKTLDNEVVLQNQISGVNPDDLLANADDYISSNIPELVRLFPPVVQERVVQEETVQRVERRVNLNEVSDRTIFPVISVYMGYGLPIKGTGLLGSLLYEETDVRIESNIYYIKSLSIFFDARISSRYNEFDDNFSFKRIFFLGGASYSYDLPAGFKVTGSLGFGAVLQSSYYSENEVLSSNNFDLMLDAGIDYWIIKYFGISLKARVDFIFGTERDIDFAPKFGIKLSF